MPRKDKQSLPFNQDYPEFINSKNVKKILNDNPLEILFALKDLPLKVGREHSNYVHEFLKESTEATDFMAMFYNKDRFYGELTLSQFLKERSPGHAAGKHISNSILSKIQLSHEIFDSRCFVGKKDHESSLHFDWNTHFNLLINLAGVKEVYLWPPSESHFLKGYSNFSNAEIDLTSKYPLRFELKKTEALLIPPLWWHKIIYVSDACSISVRIKTYEEASKWMENLYPSWKIIKTFIQLPKQEGLAFLNHLSSIAALTDDPEEKFKQVETEISNLNSGFGEDHPYYALWVIGYLKFKKLTIDPRHHHVP